MAGLRDRARAAARRQAPPSRAGRSARSAGRTRRSDAEGQRRARIVLAGLDRADALSLRDLERRRKSCCWLHFALGAQHAQAVLHGHPPADRPASGCVDGAAPAGPDRDPRTPARVGRRLEAAGRRSSARAVVGAGARPACAGTVGRLGQGRRPPAGARGPAGAARSARAARERVRPRLARGGGDTRRSRRHGGRALARGVARAHRRGRRPARHVRAVRRCWATGRARSAAWWSRSRRSPRTIPASARPSDGARPHACCE